LIDIQILDKPLSVSDCTDAVKDPSTGGTAIFIGTVRNQTQGKTVTKLEFESFDAMAIKEMTKIAEAITEKWGAFHVSMHHRKGTLFIEEIAVIIAVSTPHRKAAFEACAYAIDTLKESVPIWKKEFFEDGAVWVAAHP
jgi:molybdopterin synthase catalytic subunit